MRFLNLFFMAVSIDSIECAFYFVPSPTGRGKRSNGEVIPWIGILRVNLPNKRSDAVTGLILIAEQTAIASASDVVKIDKSTVRRTTRALFYNKNRIQWECTVKDYTVHPEYDVKTINTLAVVKLEYNPEHPHFLWRPVHWPDGTDYKQLNIFAVGFTDERKVLEQMKIRMVAVNISTCNEFYKKEKLDYQMFWPNHYSCFKAARSRSTCVYDAGMALAHWNSSSDQWTLLGVSTFGPGCSLPSRFIQIHPYKSWLASLISTRRQFNGPSLSINDPWTSDPAEDMDSMILSHLDDSSVVLRPQLAGINETLHGKCEPKIDGNLVYHEDGEYYTGNDYKSATALYSISLFDLKFANITCLMVNVNCTKRSEAKLSFHRGFGQEDFKEIIQKLPLHTPLQTRRPKIIHIPGKYIDYRSREVTTLWFKFQFMGRGHMKVLFYGTLWKDVPPTTTSTTTTTDATTTTEGP